MNPGLERADGVLSPEKSTELNFLQEKAADNAMNFLDVKTPEDPFPLIAMATGIGKGRIIHKIIDRAIRKKPDAKVLVIAGTKLTLVDQTQSALEGYTLEANGANNNWQESELADDVNRDTEDISEEKFEFSLLYKTVDYKRRKDSDANVHVATIQTIQSEDRQGKINPDGYDLVVVDEAHNIGTQARVDTVKKFKNVVGFTATPFRHSGVLKHPEQYGFTIIDSLTLPEAQEKDFLPPLIETAIPTDHLVEEIPTNYKGDIDYRKLEKLLKESEELRPFIADKIQEYINVDGKNKKAVIAVNFVWEAEELAYLLKDKGISVGVAVNQQAAMEIHSEEIPALDAIERYKLPKNDPNGIQVLVSPYVASEGFDAPETEVLVWASPTDSSVRYTQFTGRLARRSPGKLYGHVIDFLYQTAQYKWSYNFGQWMKDTVVQLPGGTLFQGSAKQRQRINQSPEVKKLGTDPKEKEISLNKMLELSELLPVQETDFSLTRETFSPIFVGTGLTLQPIGQEALEAIRQEHPELVVQRKSGSHTIEVITDRELAISKMIERGASLRSTEVQEVQPTDFPITHEAFSSTFIGGNKNLYIVGTEVLEEIRGEHPEAVVQRTSGKRKRLIQVVTDRQLILDKMVSRGINLQQAEIQDVQPTDFPMINSDFSSTFVGGAARLAQVKNEVLEEIKKEHPEMVVKRKSGNTTLEAVLDRQLVIDKMTERGIRLQQKDVQNVQPTDFVMTKDFFNSNFSGRSAVLGALRKEALEEIRKEHPEAVVLRRNGNALVEVVLDRQLVTDKVVEIRNRI